MPNGNGKDDTPITITDSSPLMLHGKLEFVKSGPHEVVPAEVNRRVTDVGVEVNRNKPKRIQFGGQMCEVDITYGKITLVAKTTPEGQMLRVRMTPGEFDKDYVYAHDPEDLDGPHTYTAKSQNAFISRVTVRQNGKVVLDGKWEKPGKKRIIIHYGYRKPDVTKE